MDKIKMFAKREFEGLEGYKKAGDSLEVERKDRAEALKKAGLADYSKAKDNAADKQAAK